MKITVLGGGGVRSPFLAKSLISNAERVGLTEIVFMDSNEEKLNIYGKIAEKIADCVSFEEIIVCYLSFLLYIMILWFLFCITEWQ